MTIKGTPTIGGDTGDGAKREDSSLFPGYIKIRIRQRKALRKGAQRKIHNRLPGWQGKSLLSRKKEVIQIAFITLASVYCKHRFYSILGDEGVKGSQR